MFQIRIENLKLKNINGLDLKNRKYLYFRPYQGDIA